MTPFETKQGRPETDEGFAILLALALLVVLSGAIALIQSIGFAAASDAAIEARQGPARLVLDAAMRKQIEQIFQSGTVDPNTVAHRAEAPAGVLSFQLDFEDGRVDVNTAAPELIKLALQAAETDAGTVESVLAAVAELRRRRLAVTDSVQLFPIESRITGRIAKDQSRHLTAFSGSKGINPSVSERELLDRVAPESAATVAQGRVTGNNLPAGAWQGWLTSNRTTIALTGAYRHKDGWTIRRKAVFRLDRGRNTIQILAWRTI